MRTALLSLLLILTVGMGTAQAQEPTRVRVCVKVDPIANTWQVLPRGAWAHGTYRDHGDSIQYSGRYRSLTYPVRRLIVRLVEHTTGTSVRVGCITVWDR